MPKTYGKVTQVSQIGPGEQCLRIVSADSGHELTVYILNDVAKNFSSNSSNPTFTSLLGKNIHLEYGPNGSSNGKNYIQNVTFDWDEV
jgi:hypothetical protein